MLLLFVLNFVCHLDIQTFCDLFSCNTSTHFEYVSVGEIEAFCFWSLSARVSVFAGFDYPDLFDLVGLLLGDCSLPEVCELLVGCQALSLP